MKQDAVNHPDHYASLNDTGVECIDAIRAALGAMSYIDWCRGNAIKYIWRCRYKGSFETDLRKAVFYLRAAMGDDPRA
jgi:hypothetical protein